MKRGLVIIMFVLLISPALAKEVDVPETYTVEKGGAVGEGATTYIYAGSKLLATKTAGELDYHYQDRLGSDVDSKALPFGQEIINGERFSFTGKELDQEPYYFEARYYDSDLGKFISVDPFTGEDGNLAYAYVGNNPLMFVDPSGMSEVNIYSLQVDTNKRVIHNNPALHMATNLDVFVTDDIQDADVLAVSGHHGTGASYIYAPISSDTPYNEVSYDSFPESSSVEVITFSACHTIMDPCTVPSSLDHVRTFEGKYPNLKAVLGYESYAGNWDTELSQALGGVVGDFLEKGNFRGLSDFWIESGQKLYMGGQSYSFDQEMDYPNKILHGRAFAAYFKASEAHINEDWYGGQGWYYTSSTSNPKPINVYKGANGVQKALFNLYYFYMSNF